MVVAVRTVADRVVRPLVRVPLHTSYACDAYTYTHACTTHLISLLPRIQIDDQYAPTVAALDEQLQKVTVVYDEVMVGVAEWEQGLVCGATVV